MNKELHKGIRGCSTNLDSLRLGLTCNDFLNKILWLTHANTVSHILSKTIIDWLRYLRCSNSAAFDGSSFIAQSSHPSQEGTQQAAGTNENAANGSNPQPKKLIISDEYFQRVTRALIMHLRQQEETVLQQGTELAETRQRDLIQWYIDQQNEKNAYSSMEEVKAELSRLKAIIECFGNLAEEQSCA
ncbi:hypothetical protein AHAS_Ahas01G0027100 [Arachis hypogaea]